MLKNGARQAASRQAPSTSGPALQSLLLKGTQWPKHAWGLLPSITSRLTPAPRPSMATATWGSIEAEVAGPGFVLPVVKLAVPHGLPALLCEGALNLALLAMWGGILYLSLQAVIVFSTVSTAGTARAVSMAARVGSTSVAQASPFILFLQAVAAMMGVVISHVSAAVAAAPGFLLHVVKSLFLAVAGSLLHVV